MGGPAAEPYDFCLSFATEQRPYVEEVAELLRKAGRTVFYDAYETAKLLGEDLYTHLDEIYNRGSRFCVLFASEAYVRKVWTRHERRSVQDRAMREAGAYLLPVRFDDTPVPGLRGTTGYVDARVTSPAELVRILLEKLAGEPQAATVSASILAVKADPHTDLEDLVRKALSHCRVSVAPELISARGSSVTAVVPEAVLSVAEVVVDVTATIADLARKGSVPALRIAVHRGQVPAGQPGESVDLTEAAEAAASAAVADVFDRVPEAGCVIVATQRVFDTVIRPGRGGCNPAQFSWTTTADGRGLYVKVPGFPQYGRPARPAGATPAGAAAPRTYHFGGPVTAGQIGDVNFFGSDDDRH
ncbi:TIR domain-containing protein [Amycolatopsis tolypomycina]|uniref:TIR domain-containing protein n=1 Tax=Amycolatopsis tolypomycina TaxID=208445 RepID=A0A1H4Q4K4_9PSEU|nr:TIR domain-containing protein [Amycolatopsis tolypomycina]SEC14554.1 TIR domain-containing protein [Amycolatopsis tolypomycina]